MNFKFFCTVFLSFILLGCTHVALKINAKKVSAIDLVEIEHHYLNESSDVRPISHEVIDNFLHDLSNAEPILNHKIFSCHEVIIHYTNGSEERFITDGKYLERIKDSTKFALEMDKNLITKYWGISEREFCVKRGHKD